PHRLNQNARLVGVGGTLLAEEQFATARCVADGRSVVSDHPDQCLAGFVFHGGTRGSGQMAPPKPSTRPRSVPANWNGRMSSTPNGTTRPPSNDVVPTEVS